MDGRTAQSRDEFSTASREFIYAVELIVSSAEQQDTEIGPYDVTQDLVPCR